jgi:transposase
MRPRPTYTEEFKQDAVRLVLNNDRSFKDVANSLGVSIWSLREWYKNLEMAKKSKKTKAELKTKPPGDETPEEQLERLKRENASLRKENESLRMDREILKKAAAFFAKESE